MIWTVRRGGAAVIEARGDLAEISSDIAYIINAIHTQLRQREPVLAETFKSAFVMAITHPKSPIWESQGNMRGIIFSVPNKQGGYENV